MRAEGRSWVEHQSIEQWVWMAYRRGYCRRLCLCWIMRICVQKNPRAYLILRPSLLCALPLPVLVSPLVVTHLHRTAAAYCTSLDALSRAGIVFGQERVPVVDLEPLFRLSEALRRGAAATCQVFLHLGAELIGACFDTRLVSIDG